MWSAALSYAYEGNILKYHKYMRVCMLVCKDGFVPRWRVCVQMTLLYEHL
jgi:hypothetical protein